MTGLEQELERTTSAVLASEEGWAKEYKDIPKQHAKLIRLMARMHRQVLTYLRDLSQEVPKYIDWYAYARAVIEQQQNLKASANVQAYNVDVIINQDALNSQDQVFIKLVFDTLAAAIATGVESLEFTLRAPIGLTTTSAIIQRLTTQQLANLVGMRVVDKGKPTEHVIPNPNAAYNIDETTRGRIAQSIKTSIQLGEDQRAAVSRLQQTIADQKRADMIARTETVRGFAEGRAEYARQSGANGKWWSDSNAIDICADNTAMGVIPIEADFVSGDPSEPAHPNCRCMVTYVYGVKQFDG